MWPTTTHYYLLLPTTIYYLLLLPTANYYPSRPFITTHTHFSQIPPRVDVSADVLLLFYPAHFHVEITESYAPLTVTAFYNRFVFQSFAPLVN